MTHAPRQAPRGLARALLSAALLALLAWLPSCGASEDAKLGGDGEACFIDTDCRDDLLCVSGLCRGEEDAEPLYTCEQSCRYLSDCGVENYPVCLEACDETTAGWDADDFNGFGECLFSKTCRELLAGQAEQCFP